MIKKYKFHLLALLFLIIINLVFYAINLNDFFVSDDFDWLHLTKEQESSILNTFGANYYGVRGEGGSYRPLVNLSFWLNHKIGGLNPLSYHLTNLIFHLGVCFLVYLLVITLFQNNKDKNKIAILAAVFFSLLPNHSEAVIWIAAIGDPLASFFYLLAFYLYLQYRQKQSFLCLIISLLSFILALLTKEIAITLPLLILVWELCQGILQNKIVITKIVHRHLGYWLVLVLYFCVRYLAIGLVFGYYATEKFSIDLVKIFNMFIALITNLFFFGQARVNLTQYFITNKLFFILILILILSLIWYLLRKYHYKIAFLFDAYLILALPVLLLAFNNLSDEGERYNYLPSVIFCILLSLLIWQIKKEKIAQYLLISGLLIYFGGILIQKNIDWQQASHISEKIVKQEIPKLIDFNNQDQLNVFVALPDNYQGTQVLRNGIKQAISLFYHQEIKSELLNVYLRLNQDNWDQNILQWETYPTGGYLAKTLSAEKWVTGIVNNYTDNYVYELWDYDYDLYITDKIRLYFQKQFLEKFEQGNLQIIYYDQGTLKKIKTSQ